MKTNHTNARRSPYKVLYFRLVLTKSDMHLQILVKIPNVKFSDNPSVVSVTVAYGQKGNRHDEANTRFGYCFANLLTSWSRVLLEKLTGSQLVKKFPSIYGTRKFNPAFKLPATCPYPEPDRSSPYTHITLSEHPS